MATLPIETVMQMLREHRLRAFADIDRMRAIGYAEGVRVEQARLQGLETALFLLGDADVERAVADRIAEWEGKEPSMPDAGDGSRYEQDLRDAGRA